MKGVIRLGDPLQNGGCVQSASGCLFMGKPVMLLGDRVLCSQHGASTAAQCHPHWRMNQRGVVVDGCKAACGCAILTTLPSAGVVE